MNIVQTPTVSEESPVQQRQKRTLSSIFNHPQLSNQSKTQTKNQNNALLTSNSILKTSSTNTPYVYIDHEKTITLKEIANERLLQHQQARRVEA